MVSCVPRVGKLATLSYASNTIGILRRRRCLGFLQDSGASLEHFTFQPCVSKGVLKCVSIFCRLLVRLIADASTEKDAVACIEDAHHLALNQILRGQSCFRGNCIGIMLGLYIRSSDHGSYARACELSSARSPPEFLVLVLKVPAEHTTGCLRQHSPKHTPMLSPAIYPLVRPANLKKSKAERHPFDRK